MDQEEIDPRGVRRRIMNASRDLFDSHGFHSTAMAELASAAKVSVGQIYRHFPSKNDIVIAIAREDADLSLSALEKISDAADRGEIEFATAIEMFAYNALTRSNEGLSFEILAESYRNPPVAEMVQLLSDRYRGLVRRLATRVNPELNEVDLEACVEIMVACFHGLGLRTSSRPALNLAQISRATGCLIGRVLTPQPSDATVPRCGGDTAA